MRRLTIIFAVVIGLLLQTSLVLAENVAPISPPDIQQIQDRGTLIVALINRDVPPFFMQDASGKLTGYDISLAENLAHALGVKVEFNRHADTYDGVVDEVANGNADIAVSLLSITLSRALKADFSAPYAYLPQALLYNRLAAAKKHYSDVAKEMVNDSNVTLGVLNKSSYVEYTQKTFPHAKIVFYPNAETGMQDVRDNKIFGFYLNEVEIKNWLSTHPDDNLYLNYQLIKNKRDPIGIAVSWRETHLLNWINWFLFVNEQNGTMAQLQKQYFQR